MADEEETKRYAIVASGAVLNIVLWDGKPPKKVGGLVFGWSPPAGTEAVECPEDVGLGWTYENGEWSPPVQATEE